MRIALTALAYSGHEHVDVVVAGDDDTTVGEVTDALSRALAPTAVPGPPPGHDTRLAVVLPHPRAVALARRSPAVEGLWSDGGPLDPSAPAAQALRDGAVVSLDAEGAAGTIVAEPKGVVELRVSGGPNAGSVHRLGIGAVAVGTAAECAVRIVDEHVASYALHVVAGPAETTVEPYQGVGAILDGDPLTGPTPWPIGGVLTLGDTVLALHALESPDAHLTPMDDGGLAYNRPPRLAPPPGRRRLEVPTEPKKSDRPRLPLLAAMLPAVMGLVMAKVTGHWYYLLMCFLSPLMMLGNFVSESRFGRKKYRQALKEYEQQKAEFETRLEQLRLTDQAERRAEAPDPAEVLLTATGPRRRLWERRIDDPDTLHLRVGVADLPAHVELVPGRGAAHDDPVPEPPRARTVPVTLPVPELGVVGLSGPRDRSRALARWLVAQAATLHSPRDLAIVVLSGDPDAADHWNWVRWLPHCAPRDGEECVALVGGDAETTAKRCADIVAQLGERVSRAQPLGTAPEQPPYNVLVVLDGARALRRVPGMPQVLGQGPQAGVFALCLDDDQRMLPEECQTVASWDWERPPYITLRGGGLEATGDVLADQVSLPWCDRLARAVAPVRDMSREDGDAAVPDAARLLDLLGAPDPTASDVTTAWERLGRTTLAPIGVGADGPFAIDLAADGPHGLIAGTTGAGKSELLQTLIASLAVANRPDAITFVLIDYKGGSAFKDCAKLPHTVGLVTDLDGHLTERALESLSAELKRREEMLLHAGAKDIGDYWDTSDAGEPLEPLPRLVLVIDEFASLVAELPEFVTGLVGIAQRGRSLGVHLILATQRPAGVVSADIRANTNLRIALRVTDTTESSDVIDAPDAARIAKSTPGRCYVRSGASSLAAVQTARVGGRRPGGDGATRRPPEVVRLPWSALGRPLTLRVGGDGEESMVTDLATLVDAIRQAAEELRVHEQRSPWLPPLPDTLTLDELPEEEAPPAAEDTPHVPPLPLGLTDLPSVQGRRTLTLDLERGGHLLVAGSPRTGRTTVLRTLAGSIARWAAPADVHVYGIDCGGGGVLPLVAMPHCGAVVGREQPDRVDRLLGRLSDEVSRRQQLLAEKGFASLAEQRAAAPADERLSWMVLMLDRWEGYVAAFEQYDMGRLVDSMLRLLREGPSVGLRAVVASDRSGLTGQVSTVFEDRIVLRLSDPSDWSLVGLTPKSVPASQPPGRVMQPAASGVLESQIALLDRDVAGTAQVAVLQRLARAATEGHPRPPRGRRALRVDALPPRVTVAETLRLDPEFAPPAASWVLVGAGGDELAPQGVDLATDGPGFVIAGPPRSGRSTALLAMARSLLDQETPVAVVTPRRSPLRSLAATPGVLGVLGADDGPDALTALLSDHDRYVVLVDDAEMLKDAPIASALEEVLRSGRDADHFLALAGTTDDLTSTYRGFAVEARRSRSGLILAPQGPSDGEILGVRLPRNAGSGPVGRGLFARAGSLLPVQVPTQE
ncbi:MAG: FtsK/SpoIIIE domain-containing protein [Streptosporangiaceae bacterium]